MDLQIFKNPDPSGRMSKESFLIKNYPEEYNYIINYCEINGIQNVSFKEKVYLSINNVKSIPLCKNPNCKNNVKFKNSSLGYLSYCSNKCISSDPDIIKIKEDNSLKKFGTKSPSQSNMVKDKIIKTNNLRYGGNSPMNDENVQLKSKQTLIENYGVDNPNKSKIISDKRVESFKKNIDQYIESYKKTSIERYGVEHPWMDKNIHYKTIESFYSDYRKRIEDKISDDYKFLGFEKSNSTILKFKCNKCGEDFDILTYQFYYRINHNNSICTKCFPISENSSIDQLELFNFIKNNYDGDVLLNNKNIISPYEIDIYLPELKVGFEFNGVFWHSDKFKESDYHFKKYSKSLENNINLITIWEDDWTVKNDICKSFILNKISKTPNKIFARKCEVKEIDYNTSKEFLNNNHLQGDCKSSVRIGLYYNDELVSLMTFSKLRLPLQKSSKNRDLNNHFELTRFCNKNYYNIVGGASKLFKYYLNNYNPVQIETYSDNLISDGGLYKILGFEYKHTSNPGYWYLVDGIRSHRFNFRKSKLVKLGYDSNKTEEEIMLELGYYRIYNAGNKKWIFTKL